VINSSITRQSSRYIERVRAAEGVSLRFHYVSRNYIMSITRFFAALSIMVCSSFALAKDEAPSCPPPPMPPSVETMQTLMKNAKDRGFLWKLEKGGRTSFLFGTIHANTAEWMIPGPKTFAALRDADVIVVELNPLDPDVTATLSDPKKLGMNPPELSESLKTRIAAQLKRTCVPLEFSANQPPMMQVMGATIFDARFAGLEAAYGSEIFLIGVAQGTKKPVVSLESAASQLRAIVGFSQSNEVLESALAQLETGKARRMIARLHAAWGASNTSDLENLERWCECLDTETDRKYLQQLNDDRNPALAKGIDKVHSDGKRAFAAVGALHMFGPKALPKLLKEMGYTVERVSF
jgi:uncharacterized protein